MNKKTILYDSDIEDSSDESNTEEIAEECAAEVGEVEPIVEQPIKRNSCKKMEPKYSCRYCNKAYVRIDKFTQHETRDCSILKNKKEKEAEMILNQHTKILEKAKRTEYLKRVKERREASRPVVEKVVEKRGRKLLPKTVEKVVEIEEEEEEEIVVPKKVEKKAKQQPQKPPTPQFVFTFR